MGNGLIVDCPECGKTHTEGYHDSEDWKRVERILSIEQRLREAHPESAQYANGSKMLLEAADRIRQLEAFIRRYRYRMSGGDPMQAAIDRLLNA